MKKVLRYIFLIALLICCGAYWVGTLNFHIGSSSHYFDTAFDTIGSVWVSKRQNLEAHVLMVNTGRYHIPIMEVYDSDTGEKYILDCRDDFSCNLYIPQQYYTELGEAVYTKDITYKKRFGEIYKFIIHGVDKDNWLKDGEGDVVFVRDDSRMHQGNYVIHTKKQSLYDPENYLEIIDGLYKKAEGKENVLLNMNDGLTDPAISEMYAGDISDAKRMTESGWIELSYYDCDLNDDGLGDKIVIIESPLHGGTGGNPFDVLIAKEDGGYNIINNLVLRVFPGEDVASMYILDDKTNGYHDILIKSNKPAYDYTPVLIQKQTDDTYLPVIRRSDALHYVASNCVEGITEDQAVSLLYDVLGNKVPETGNEIRYIAKTTGRLDGVDYYCITAEMYDGDSWVQTDELMVAASGDAIYVGERIYDYHLLGVLWKK